MELTDFFFVRRQSEGMPQLEGYSWSMADFDKDDVAEGPDDDDDDAPCTQLIGDSTCTISTWTTMVVCG